MKYPSTPPKKLVETIHGYKVTDNYRWLENLSSKTVKDWINAQNKLTDQVISSKLQAKIEKELEKACKFPSLSAPRSRNGLYFGWERKVGQEQAVVYVQHSLHGKKRILIDPNELSQKTGHIVSLESWFLSHKGDYVAYRTSVDGSELAALKVMDVKTGKDIEKVSDNSSYSLTWLPDDSGFFYTAHPKIGTVPKGEERYHEKTYFHKLGTKPTSDKLIFGNGRPKEDMLSLHLSIDGRWLIISASLDWECNDLYLYDTKTAKTTDLIVGYDANFDIVFTKKHILLFTNYQAPNCRILYSNLKTPPNGLKLWKNFIPERKYKIDNFWVTTNRILVTYQINVSIKGFEFDYNGKEIADLPIPKHASLMGISANKYEAEYFYSYATFITPQVTMHYNPETRKCSELFRLKSTLNETDYEVKQEWFHSKDRTKVPMYIIHHRNVKLDGKNPTILSGYGGFESSNLPYFLRNLVPWLMKGGIFAIANIRGGGEFGKTWHTSAIRKNKQKSYDDFIAAAEHLITKQYTINQRLGIWGGSNGGLLVSAVAVQRPDLFKAVVPQVPLTDMVRFPKFLIASRWISEYGDPNDPKELKYILKYSPYHNVDKDKNYPAFLFTTAVNDTRVHPMHAYKMGALLQSLNSNEPILIYTQNSSGHTGSLTMSRFYKNQARVLAFFAEQLSLII